jgi:hypothetical protein
VFENVLERICLKVNVAKFVGGFLRQNSKETGLIGEQLWIGFSKLFKKV